MKQAAIYCLALLELIVNFGAVFLSTKRWSPLACIPTYVFSHFACQGEVACPAFVIGMMSLSSYGSFK